MHVNSLTQLFPTFLLRCSLALLGLSCLVETAQAQDRGSSRQDRGSSKMKKLTAGDDSFVYQVPADWTITHGEGDPHPSAMAPLNPGSDFPAISAVHSEDYNGSLAGYVKIAVDSLYEEFPGAKELKRKDFRTTSGEKGTMVDFDIDIGELKLRTTCWFFVKDGTGYGLILMHARNEAAQYAKLGDQIAKTFEFIEP